VGEVGRGQRECLTVQVRITDKNAPDRVLQVHPLMKIKCKRIRPIHSGDKMPVVGSDGGPCPEGAIYVEPAPFPRTDIRDGIKVVDRGGIGSPGNTDHTEREKPGTTIFFDQ
jgi:hypothetical protein